MDRNDIDSWNEVSRKNTVAQALAMSSQRLRERERAKGRFLFAANRSGSKKSSRFALGAPPFFSLLLLVPFRFTLRK